MPNTTRTNNDIPREVNNFYDRTLLSRLLPMLQYIKFAQIRDIPRNAGTNTIKFRRYNSLTPATTPLVEGVTPAGQKLATTEQIATVKQYGDYVPVTDVVQYESPDAVLAETYELQGEQVAETFDTLMRDVLAAGTSVWYPDGRNARNEIEAGDTITVAGVRQVVRQLTRNRAKRLTRMVQPDQGFMTTPLDNCFIGIAGPDVEYDLKTLFPTFVPVEHYANKANILEGEFGKLDNVRFLLSHNTPLWENAGVGNTDVHGTIIFGQDAYGMTRIAGEALKTITKALGSAGTADPLDQRTTAGWKGTFVGKILQELAIIRYETAATE